MHKRRRLKIITFSSTGEKKRAHHSTLDGVGVNRKSGGQKTSKKSHQGCSKPETLLWEERVNISIYTQKMNLLAKRYFVKITRLWTVGNKTTGISHSLKQLTSLTRSRRDPVETRLSPGEDVASLNDKPQRGSASSLESFKSILLLTIETRETPPCQKR